MCRAMWSLPGHSVTARDLALSGQTTEPRDILRVRTGAVDAGHFQHPGQRAEHGLRQQLREAGIADVALTDVGMAVAMGAERVERVVGVDGHQAVESDLPLEFVEGAVHAIAGRDVVASGKDVTSIQADAEALII